MAAAVEKAMEGCIEVNCSVLGNDDPQASVCEQPIAWTEILSYEDKYLRGGGKGKGGGGEGTQARYGHEDLHRASTAWSL